jgi:antitoxin (DNA-binding transcriptional repressor) of toxin-antitoxin stability system
MSDDEQHVVRRVGVKEFRDRLAYWLDVAASGEDVVVTEHGKAKVRVSEESGRAVLERLAAQGKVRLATQPWRPLKPPVPVRGGGSPVTDEILKGHGH